MALLLLIFDKTLWRTSVHGSGKVGTLHDSQEAEKRAERDQGQNNPSEALHSSAIHFFLPGPTIEISDTSWQSRGNLSLSVDVIIDWIRALVIYLGKFLYKCIQRCTSLISEALLNQLSR